jgi:hypothetical protein
LFSKEMKRLKKAKTAEAEVTKRQEVSFNMRNSR